MYAVVLYSFVCEQNGGDVRTHSIGAQATFESHHGKARERSGPVGAFVVSLS